MLVKVGLPPIFGLSKSHLDIFAFLVQMKVDFQMPSTKQTQLEKTYTFLINLIILFKTTPPSKSASLGTLYLLFGPNNLSGGDFTEYLLANLSVLYTLLKKSFEDYYNIFSIGLRS